MSSTKTNPDAESIQSGIAALEQTADPFSEPGPYDVSGLAMPENVVTQGGSGTTRMWPAETLRDAADMLEGKSIVADFHPASPEQAPAGNIVGKITEAGYEDGVGLRFSGEVTDQDIAKKIDRDYLEVSTRPAIAEEQYDPERDLYVVESIADFLDIGLVDWGAAGGNEVGLGSDPAVAALARSAIGYRGDYQYDALQDTTVSEPNWDGYSTASWSAPSLDGTFGGDMDAARNSATFIRDGGESFGDLSLFVVDGDRQLNLNGLDSAWLMASQTDDVSSDEVSRLRGMYESMAESARNAGEIGDSAWEETWQPRIEGEEDTESNESNSNTITQYMTAPYTAALQEDGDGEDSGDTRLDVWSDFLADMSGSVSVDEVNFDNLHRLLASEIPGADISDVAGALPAEDFDEGFGAADARELISGLVDSDGEDGDDESESEESESEDEGEDEEDEEDEDTESNAQYAPGITGALQRELDLTGSTPDRCFSIKSGAKKIDVNESALARDILNIPDEDRRPKTINVYENPIARDVLNIEDEEDVETIDINESPVDRKALGLEEPDPAEEARPEAEQEREVETVDLEEDAMSRHVLGIEDMHEAERKAEEARPEAEQEREVETVDLDEDPMSRHLLGIEDIHEDEEDEEYRDPAVKSFGERVQQGKGGGTAEDVEDEDDEEEPGTVNVDDEPIFQHLLGIEDDEDDEPDRIIKSFGDRVRKRVQEDDTPETRNIREDPVSSQALGIESSDGDDTNTEDEDT